MIRHDIMRANIEDIMSIHDIMRVVIKETKWSMTKMKMTKKKTIQMNIK